MLLFLFLNGSPPPNQTTGWHTCSVRQGPESVCSVICEPHAKPALHGFFALNGSHLNHLHQDTEGCVSPADVHLQTLTASTGDGQRLSLLSILKANRSRQVHKILVLHSTLVRPN